MTYTDSRRHWIVRAAGMKPVTLPPRRTFDAAIGIGIGTSRDGQYANSRSGANALGCLQAVESGRAGNIILTGGQDGRPRKPNGITEAEGMLRLIEDRATMPLRVYLDLIAKKTKFNALNTLKIMQACFFRTAAIYAEALHAPRVERTFRKIWPAKFPFVVIPTYGLYDDGVGLLETPHGFFVFNTAVTIGEPIMDACRPVEQFFEKMFNRAA